MLNNQRKSIELKIGNLQLIDQIFKRSPSEPLLQTFVPQSPTTSHTRSQKKQSKTKHLQKQVDLSVEASTTRQLQKCTWEVPRSKESESPPDKKWELRKEQVLHSLTVVLSFFKKKSTQVSKTFTPQDLHSKVLLTNPSDTTKASVCDFSRDSKTIPLSKFHQRSKKGQAKKKTKIALKAVKREENGRAPQVRRNLKRAVTTTRVNSRSKSEKSQSSCSYSIRKAATHGIISMARVKKIRVKSPKRRGVEEDKVEEKQNNPEEQQDLSNNDLLRAKQNQKINSILKEEFEGLTDERQIQDQDALDLISSNKKKSQCPRKVKDSIESPTAKKSLSGQANWDNRKGSLVSPPQRNRPERERHCTASKVEKSKMKMMSPEPINRDTRRNSTMNYMKDLDATRGVFKKLLQSQELKKILKEKEKKEAKEAVRAKKSRETERVRQMNMKKGNLKIKKDVFFYKIPEINNIQDLQKFSMKIKKAHESPRESSRKSFTEVSLQRISSNKLLSQTTPRRSEENSHQIYENISSLLATKLDPPTQRLKIPLVNKDNTLSESFGITTQDQENASPRILSPNFQNLLTSRYGKNQESNKHQERLTMSQKALLDQVKLSKGVSLIKAQKQKRKQIKIEEQLKIEEQGLRVQKNLDQLNETYRKSHTNFQQNKVQKINQQKEKKAKKLLSKSVKTSKKKETSKGLRRSPSLPVTISPIAHLADQDSMTPQHRSQGHSPCSSFSHITPAPFSCSIPVTETKTPIVPPSYAQKSGYTPLKSLELYSKLLPEKVEEEDS